MTPPDDTLIRIIREIKEHDRLNPSHGVGCSCHDGHSGVLRGLFEREGLYESRGGYPFPTKSLHNLLVVLGYVQRNP